MSGFTCYSVRLCVISPGIMDVIRPDGIGDIRWTGDFIRGMIDKFALIVSPAFILIHFIFSIFFAIIFRLAFFLVYTLYLTLYYRRFFLLKYFSSRINPIFLYSYPFIFIVNFLLIVLHLENIF